MSATGAEAHRTRGVLLNGLGWLACVIATLVLAGGAANRRGGDGYAAGYAVGGLVSAFVIAFGIGLTIQWGVRKRRTLPAWIGLIAVAVSAVMLLLSAARQASAAACVPPARVYGRPPAHWTYVPPTPAKRAQVVRLMRLTAIHGTDVTLARHGSAVVVLVAIPNMHDAYVRGAEKGARDAHATVTHTAYGASAFEFPRHEVRSIVGLRGCNAVFIDGHGDAAVNTVARAVFR